MKKIPLLFAAICILSLCGCSSTKDTEAVTKWDCSVTAAADNTDDAYVITYSNEEIRTQTGVFTIQNRNTFPVKIHLSTAGKQELSEEILPGGWVMFHHITPDTPYPVGAHAEVTEGTDIAIMAYDGTSSDPY